MKEFMEYDFKVLRVSNAVFVELGNGRAIHKNRPSHDLALNLNEPKDYHFSGNRTVTVGTNEIIYMPQGSNYSVRSKVSGNCYAINFVLSEPVDFPGFVFRPKNFREFFDRFKHCEQLFRTQKPGSVMQCKAELYQILGTMQQEYAMGYLPSDRRRLLQPALQQIHEKYTGEDRFCMDELAELCGISTTYFRRLFHQCHGVSPVKYINDLRIARAKELLASGMYSVKEAAELSGYRELSYFSREFRKAEGSSPLVYQQKIRRGE